MLTLAFLIAAMSTPLDAVTTIDTVGLNNSAAFDSIGATGSGGSGSGGYDIVNRSNKRKSRASTIVREDNLLKHGRRTRLQATTQDLIRNFAITGWMIRRHLDYVALFDFHSRCQNSRRLTKRYKREDLQRLDDDIERLMKEDSKKRAFDAGRRCSREKFFRLCEMQRTINGDVGAAKLKNGKLQGIESDLIRNPDDKAIRHHNLGKSANWIDGVWTGAAGVAQKFALSKRPRSGSNYEFSRVVPAKHMIHYGHFNRFATDQTRGVSPIVPALKNLCDVDEGFDLALAKMKVSQLFALAIYSDARDGAGHFDEDEEVSDDAEGEGEAAPGPRYNVNFGAGPVHLELDELDRAEFLESKTPSIEMQNFCHTVTAVALKSLDIPYSFYDESHTNFFGSRASWQHYERSTVDKRNDQIEMREDYTIWKLRLWVISGRLVLLPGMSISDIETEWVPRGMPWWDPAKEIRGDLQAIGAGFDNPANVCKRTGKPDVLDNARATMHVIAAVRQMSMDILGDPNAFTLNFDAKPDIALVQSKPSEESDQDADKSNKDAK